jgi:hypothetical protein
LLGRNGRIPAGPGTAAAARPVWQSQQLPARCRLFQHLRRRATSWPVANNDILGSSALDDVGRPNADHVVHHVGGVCNVGNVGPRPAADASPTTTAAAGRRIFRPEPDASETPSRRTPRRRLLSGPALRIRRPASPVSSLHAATATAISGSRASAADAAAPSTAPERLYALRFDAFRLDAFRFRARPPSSRLLRKQRAATTTGPYTTILPRSGGRRATASYELRSLPFAVPCECPETTDVPPPATGLPAAVTSKCFSSRSVQSEFCPNNRTRTSRPRETHGGPFNVDDGL